MKEFFNWCKQWRNYFQIDLLAYAIMIVVFIVLAIFVF